MKRAALLLLLLLPVRAEAIIPDPCDECAFYLQFCCAKPCPILDTVKLGAIAQRIQATTAIVRQFTDGVQQTADFISSIGENLFYPDPIIDLIKGKQCVMPTPEPIPELEELKDLFNPGEEGEEEGRTAEISQSMQDEMLRRAKKTLVVVAKQQPELQKAWANAERQLAHAEDAIRSATDNRGAARALAAAQQASQQFESIMQEAEANRTAVRGAILARAKTR